jgi:hypothetical protein
MKLHKQTRLKVALTAAIAGLMVAFLGLIRADPGVDAEAQTPASPTPDYGQFFAPNRTASPAVPGERPPAHTRSRSS